MNCYTDNIVHSILPSTTEHNTRIQISPYRAGGAPAGNIDGGITVGIHSKPKSKVFNKS